MDDDGEVDSQSEVVVGSLSWWMMKSLWKEDTLPEQKLQLSLPDTVLLQDGHLLYWFFTSAKSGNILKVRTLYSLVVSEYVASAALSHSPLRYVASDWHRTATGEVLHMQPSKTSRHEPSFILHAPS